MDLTPCRCVPGARCVPMPNRFRRAFKMHDFSEALTPEQVADAHARVAAALADEGIIGELAHCQSMEPVVFVPPALAHRREYA